MLKMIFFWKFEILISLIFWSPNLYIFRKPLLHIILIPNFVKFRRRVSELEGIIGTKLCPLCPAGTILTPRGRHLHCTCAIPGCIYPESLRSLRPPLRCIPKVRQNCLVGVLQPLGDGGAPIGRLKRQYRYNKPPHPILHEFVRCYHI